MGSKAGLGILVLGIVGVIFGFNKLSELSKKSEGYSNTVVSGYLNDVKNKKYEEAYQKYFHSELTKIYDISTYIQGQKENETKLGDLKEFRVIQIRNGAGFSKIDDYTIFLELKYTNSIEDIVIRIKRKDENSENFLVEGIWKGSYNRSAIYWEKRIY